MSSLGSSYRPHNPGHDYYAPGIYLITLVVRHRSATPHLLGTLNDDLRHPAVVLSDVGHAVKACWEAIPERQAQYGRKVVVHGAVCMPDHFHGVIEIVERMDVSLGQVICGFKTGCTQAWRQLSQPCTAAQAPGQPLAPVGPLAPGQPSAPGQPYMAALHRMSRRQRAAYYASHPEALQPLWDDDYDDTICLSDPVTGDYSQRHFSAMVQYVADNARRAIMRRRFPQFYERCLHVRIPGTDAQGRPVMRDYAAFGNLFLLRWAKKVQVFCHRLARREMLSDEEWQAATASWEAIGAFERHAREHRLGHYDRDWHRAPSPTTCTPIDFTRTAAFRRQHDTWVTQVLAGATVVVTPGISPGERAMKDECIARGFPLIHLQKEPIGALWKPEKARFDACSNGALLILAPWKADTLGEVHDVPSHADYAIFHNLNRLAQEICLFDGQATLAG